VVVVTVAVVTVVRGKHGGGDDNGDGDLSS